MLAALVGLVLTFGGTCGAGPTSLSRLAVSGPQTLTPDDARGQVLAPETTEVAQPARRRVVRRVGGRIGRDLVRAVRRVVGSWAVGAAAGRAPPPLRGPPALVV